MKPKVLLSSDMGVGSTLGRNFFSVKRSYSLALTGAGAVPLMAVDITLYKEYAELADALVLTDGSLKISPGRYGEAIVISNGDATFDIPVNPYRDSMELCLCKAFMEAGKPILGIGRGMHIINVALGGTLTQVIEQDKLDRHYPMTEHRIVIKENTKLAELLGNDCSVSSFHHSAINKLANGLKVSAVSEDGLIEAFEHESLRIYGVQWNPEIYKTDDMANYMAYKDADKPAPPASAEVKAVNTKLYTRKTALPELPSTFDSVRPDDNPIFNFFVKQCKGGSENE